MPRLAFLTFGVLLADWNQPQVQGFVDRIFGSFEAAEASEGFIDRARRTDIGSPVTQWGEFDYPAFLSPDQYARVAQTLSVWEDLESVFAFAYGGFHAEGLKYRKEWVEESHYPNYAAWWVADDHIPSYAEARLRLEQLIASGASATVFTFKQAYGPDGAPITVDRARVKELMERNAATTG